MIIPEWILMAWKEKVHDQIDKVDPLSEQDWYSIALGFALGFGFKPSDAHAIAHYIRNS